MAMCALNEVKGMKLKMNTNVTEPVTNTKSVANNSKPESKKIRNVVIIISVIFVVVVIAVIALFVFIFSLISSNSNQLVCKSNTGNITIMYNDSTIVGYTATGMSYDLDQQKKVANQIGIDNYVSQFSDWFKTNTDGTCFIKEKEAQ